MKAKLFVLLDEAGYDTRLQPDLPEINAYVKFKGRSAWTPMVVRVDPEPQYLAAHAPTMWFGDSYLFSGRNYGGTAKNCVLIGLNQVWNTMPDQPITEVKLEVRRGPGPGGVITGTYQGDRKVAVKGIWFGYEAATPGTVAYPLKDTVTLGVDLTHPVVLSRNQPSVTYAIQHTMPEYVR